MKVGGKYVCVVCKQSAPTKHLLKSHIFQKHTEVELHKVQGKSINEYIGAEMMTRLRVVAFNAIASDNFDGYIFGLLGYSKEDIESRFKEFRLKGSRYKEQFRSVFDVHYEKRREMILKAAPSHPGPPELTCMDYSCI